jgi:hypothetical protein
VGELVRLHHRMSERLVVVDFAREFDTYSDFWVTSG